ncbi:MAG: hypothetical protein CVT74_16415 [Alphaproteobacteria bacterium HGW-Alphaproteobacteria-13]|nr:MAG: hypothetical protein CVT74_16415 [Alphaproteobacteria bacterium HGW-Alphaproteobacteria-13]
MTGFVATPPAPHSPPGATVAADGWFPAIDVGAMRAGMRLRGETPHARLVEAIRGAIVTVLVQLSDWQIARIAEGCTSLAMVKPGETIDGEHRLSLLFARAVRLYAAAELAAFARDSSATNDEVDRIDEESLVGPDMTARALAAVRDILGTTRIDVELI